MNTKFTNQAKMAAHNVHAFITRTAVAATLLAVASATTSCKDEEIEVSTAVQITATVTGTADMLYTPPGGTLQLYYGSVGSEQSTTAHFTDTQWFIGAPLYWEQLTPKAGYAFFAVAPAVPADLIATVSSDQSELEAYTASDQLIAYTQTDKTVPSLPLAFKHVLAQLKVIVSAEVAPTDPSYIDPASAELAIDGVRLPYALDYTDATTETPAIATVTDAAVVAKLIPLKSGGGTFYAMHPAQTFAAKALNLTFTIADKTYTWSNPEPITTVAGKSLKVILKVNKGGITIPPLGVIITDWDNSLAITDEVRIDGLSDETAQTGNFTPMAGDELLLAGGDQTGAYTYENSSWSSDAPIYWGNMPAGATTFDALYTPITSVVHNEKDYLTGTAKEVAFGAPINLNMMHAMAKITVDLKAGTGFAGTVEEELASAVINLKALKAITLAGIELNENIASITGDTKFVEQTPYIVAPQETVEGATIVLTKKNGHKYTVELSSLKTENGTPLTALEPGNNYAITLILKDEAISVGMEIIDWNSVTINDQEVVIDDIVDETGVSTYTAVTGDELKLWYTGAPDDKKVIYTYNAAATPAWEAEHPLFWDAIPEAVSYTFNALYTPLAQPAGNEKDYLIGKTEALQIGNAVNLTMEHAMAKIAVKLMPGIPASDLPGGAINLKGLAAIADNGTISLEENVKSITGETAFAYETEYIVAPQQLTSANTIVLTSTTGHTYTLDLSKVTALTAELKANTIYTIQVTVKDAEVSVAVKMKAWDKITGDGEAS